MLKIAAAILVLASATPAGGVDAILEPDAASHRPNNFHESSGKLRFQPSRSGRTVHLPAGDFLIPGNLGRAETVAVRETIEEPPKLDQVILGLATASKGGRKDAAVRAHAAQWMPHVARMAVPTMSFDGRSPNGTGTSEYDLLVYYGMPDLLGSGPARATKNPDLDAKLTLVRSLVDMARGDPGLLHSLAGNVDSKWTPHILGALRQVASVQGRELSDGQLHAILPLITEHNHAARWAVLTNWKSTRPHSIHDAFRYQDRMTRTYQHALDMTLQAQAALRAEEPIIYRNLSHFSLVVEDNQIIDSGTQLSDAEQGHVLTLQTIALDGSPIGGQVTRGVFEARYFFKRQYHDFLVMLHEDLHAVTAEWMGDRQIGIDYFKVIAAIHEGVAQAVELRIARAAAVAAHRHGLWRAAEDFDFWVEERLRWLSKVQHAMQTAQYTFQLEAAQHDMAYVEGLHLITALLRREGPIGVVRFLQGVDVERISRLARTNAAYQQALRSPEAARVAFLKTLLRP